MSSELDFLFVFLVLIVRELVPILGLFLFFLVVILRDRVDLDGVNLDDFHFRFALGAGQDFAFLDFVFVNVNFSGAFRAPDHGTTSLRIGCESPVANPREFGHVSC